MIKQSDLLINSHTMKKYIVILLTTVLLMSSGTSSEGSGFNRPTRTLEKSAFDLTQHFYAAVKKRRRVPVDKKHAETRQEQQTKSVARQNAKA